MTKEAAFYITGIIVLAIIVIVASRRSNPDGFDVDTKGRPIRWTKFLLPIRVGFHSALDFSWRATVRGAVVRFNLAVDRPVFQISNALYPEAGTVVFAPSSKRATGNHWDQIDMNVNGDQILSALVVLPREASCGRMALVVHLLGHVLGLRHVDNVESMMHQNIVAQVNPGLITGKDAERLRRHYG